MQVFGFPPEYQEDAKVLILGSMPGRKSLDAHQYYAHPRNAFWPIMAKLYGTSLPEIYSDRLAILKSNRCALWDVLANCRREGSLDSNIDAQSEQANDFYTLFRKLPDLQLIAFNGKKAEQSFRKHFKSDIELLSSRYRFVALPSTSPANAGISLEEKYQIWSEGLDYS